MTDSLNTENKHWDCVTQAAAQIFNSTCGVEVALVPEQDLSDDGVVLGIISLVGEVEWSLFLGLPRQTAVSVAAKFAGFEIPFDSNDMGDAVGELTNIFAGQVKALLDERGVKAEISLPSVLRAENMHVLIQRHASAAKVCYQTDLGKFWTGILACRNAVVMPA